ncbi:MAG: ACT domain-containing protein [Clostridia bacterium]|nr:ACT domain-containing protein [Clostridia bacterium]
MSEKTFYIVSSDSLPDVFNKVVFAKDLLENGSAKNISDAIAKVGISRSAFYKYKDNIFRMKDSLPTKLDLSAVLADRAGVLSAMSSMLSEYGANIITINQSEPKNNLATVSITIAVDGLSVSVDQLLTKLKTIDGIISIKAI